MKKLGHDRRSRGQILIVFLGAVMLPSLILAYLGLRYIRQEEQWQGQLVVQNLEVALSNAARTVDEELRLHVREAFVSLTSHTALPTLINPLQLHTFSRDHALVEEVLLLDQQGGLLFPRSYRSQSRPVTDGTALGSPTLTEHLVRGEEFEARGNYREALEEFEEGLVRSKTGKTRLAFRIRIARCLYATGSLDAAQDAYRQVVVEDGNHFWGEALPYRLIARFRLAEISKQQGKPEEECEYLLELYGEIVRHFDRFEQPQYEYHLARVKATLSSLRPQGEPTVSVRLDSLSRVEETFLGERVQREFLERHAFPLIETVLHTKPEPNSIRYATVDVPESSVSYAFLELDNAAGVIRFVGIRLRFSQLIAYALESVGRIAVGENIHVELLNRDGEPLALDAIKSAPAVLETPLNGPAGITHGFKLAIVATPGTPIEEITSRSLTLYYVLIGIVTVVILLGILFIYHETSRERELARMKSEFISNVTHEIKTPIATIRTLAENVNEGWVRSPDKHEQYFRLIARESERLGHLVENTLDFSRIESGRKQYRLENGSLREVLESTVDRFRILTHGQGVEITCSVDDTLPLIRMDEVAIGEALMNLLDNAVKYSRERTIVALTAFVEGDEIRIEVKDAGIGMDRKELSRIFEKFYRAEPAAGRKVPGSGIGLTLVKDIVEAHSGRIEVLSERNAGSTFTIILPMAQKESHADDSAN